MSEARKPTVITQEAFDKIECNRCGECCEAFYIHEGPLEFLARYGRHNFNAEWLAYTKDGGRALQETYDPGTFMHDLTQNRNGLESMMFYGQLEIHQREDGEWMAKCGHFTRDPDGLGVCTIYDQRPAMCAEFPYGKPTNGFPSCVWDSSVIEVLDFEPVMSCP